MVNDLPEVIFGKGPGGQSVLKDAEGHAPMWKKKSIFWELDYLKFLEVRSSIDVMHVTKNICVNLLGFLGVYGKTKDTPEAREDQQHMKYPGNKHTDKGRKYLSRYALTKAEKEIFFQCLSSIKVLPAKTHRRAATSNTKSREAPRAADGPWSLGRRPAKLRHTSWL